MNLPDTLRQLSPPHILIDGLRQEQQMKARYNLEMSTLPTEGGIMPTLEIARIRLKTIAHAVGATTLSLTVAAGVGLAAETISRHL